MVVFAVIAELHTPSIVCRSSDFVLGARISIRGISVYLISFVGDISMPMGRITYHVLAFGVLVPR